MKIDIDSGAEFIIEELEKNGFEAFVVGGCVRDTLMGRIPNDWDITTSAKPEDVQKIFDRTIPTGIKHGTITVLHEGKNYEVTTYRIDGEYTDNRRPDFVEYSTNIIDDLSRRDFTINAMAYNGIRGLIDEFHGLEDIKNKVVKCVGVPDKRFDEDALRILRAIRLSAKLDFKIEEKTYLSMKKNANNIGNVSVERITSEVEEIIEYDSTRLDIAKDIGIFKYIFGNIDIFTERHSRNFGTGYILDVDKRYIQTLKRAICFKNIDNNRIEEILKRMRYSNKDIHDTACIHRVMMDKRYDSILDLLDGCNKFDNNAARSMIKNILREIDDIELSKVAIYSKFIEKKLNPSVCFDVFDDIIIRGECFSISKLKINGRDLMEENIAKGEKIGKILNKLLDYIIDNPEDNYRKFLLKYAREIEYN